MRFVFALVAAVALLHAQMALGAQQQRDDDVDMALHEAIVEGRTKDVEKMLLEGKANIESVHKTSRQKPIVAAVLSGELEIVKLLVAHGANESASIDGYTLVHAAAFQGRNYVMDYLMSRGHPHTTFHTDGYAPVHRAAWGKTSGHTYVLDSLALAGVDLNLPDQVNGNTPLMMAVDQKEINMQMLGFLIGSGVDINLKNKHGLTAVMMACLGKRATKDHLVYALVQAGADLNVTDANGRTTRDYVLKEGGLKPKQLELHSLAEDPRIVERINKQQQQQQGGGGGGNATAETGEGGGVRTNSSSGGATHYATATYNSTENMTAENTVRQHNHTATRTEL